MFTRKTISCVLAFTLIVSLFAACGTSQPSSQPAESTSQSQAQSEQPAQSEESASGEAPSGAQQPTYPLVEPGSATLKVATRENWYTPKSYNENLPVYQELEKLTGVKIEWEALPVSEYDAIIQTRISSGTDLPDIFNAPWTSSNLDKVGSDGIAVNMTDLIAENAFYLNRLMEMQPIVRSSITAADGNIYWYPGFGEGLISGYMDMETGVREDPMANINLHVPFIRKDWLDQLGLEVPTTMDEWHTVLTAFKNNPSLGNGTVIPLITNWSFRDILSFCSINGLYVSGNAGDQNFGGWDVGADGKIIYKYADERLRDTIAILAQWYSEGLIDPEFTNESRYDYNLEKINKNIVGACASDWMSNAPTFNNNLSSIAPDANYIPIKQAKDAQGNSYTYNRWSIWKDVAISKDCQNPELAMKWIDTHCLSPEGIKLQMFGVEGTSYTNDNGKLKYTDFVLNNPDGLGPFEAVRSLGGWAQIAYIQTKEAYVGLYESNPQMLEFSASYKANEVFTPFPSPTCLPYTVDESTEYSDIMANVKTYRDENLVKFINGSLSIDKWDDYVKGLEGMGLNRAIEITQAAYERFEAASK